MVGVADGDAAAGAGYLGWFVSWGHDALRVRVRWVASYPAMVVEVPAEAADEVCGVIGVWRGVNRCFFALAGLV